MEIRRLSDLDMGRGAANGRRMRVCIVSSEFPGPVKNSGIGTVTAALAKHLVRDGHEVTLLYTYVGHGKPVTGDRPWSHWVQLMLSEGIYLHHIPHEGDYRAWRAASWVVKDFLANNGPYDLVYFNDYFGSGYYSLAAKRANLASFRDQVHCLITHGSMEWVFNLNDYYATRLSDIEWMGLERRSIEMADIVIAPSRYLIREYESYGWKLPTLTFHQPYPIFESSKKVRTDRNIAIDEFVFFGRLEVRKGLWIFCEALDHLADRCPGIDVTFLGRVTNFAGISSALQIVNRSRNWSYRVRLLSDFDQEQALSYLRKPGRLAVMPSLADNSPCVVYECMEAGIPFVATSGSGADELVSEDSWNNVMIQPNVGSLTKKLADIMEHGAGTGKPRFDPDENIATWSAWHRFVSQKPEVLSSQPIFLSKPGIRFQGSAQAALIVVVDTGDCALTLLIENLCSHIRRFDKRAAYLIFSSRGDVILEGLQAILTGTSDVPTIPLLILNSRAIDEARTLIFGSQLVFFTDAETEIFTSFFVTALESLQKQARMAVSCAVAVRQELDEPGQIEELPCGVIPGLSAFGEPLGGSVCAVTAANLAKELSSVPLYDPHADLVVPSSELVQMLMERCRSAQVPIRLLPIVGAVETRERGACRRRTTMDTVHRRAAAIGVRPSVYDGGPAWLAISSLSSGCEWRESTLLECPEILGLTHEQSLDHSSYKQSAEELKPIDLLKRLTSGVIFEYGVSLLPKARKTRDEDGHQAGADRGKHTWAVAANSDNESSPILRSARECVGQVYLDARRLQVRKNRIQSNANLRRCGSGKMFIIDVPLYGAVALIVVLRMDDSLDRPLARVRVIDQRQGSEIGTSSTRLAPNASADMSIALHGIHGRATIEFEFSESEKIDVALEALRIEVATV